MNKEYATDSKVEAAIGDNVEPVEAGILTGAEKRRLTRKLDLRLMPILWLLYFVNLLDRVSVGSAVAYGFRRDIGVSGQLYNVGISVFCKYT